MRVSRAEKLAGNLRRGIRAQCLSQMLILRKGYGLRGTVDRRTGGEDKSFHSGQARRFEQMQCAGDIGVVIKLWILNRWSNACASGQMRDYFELLAMKQISH